MKVDARFSVWVDDAYLIYEAGQWYTSRWPYPQDSDPCFRCGTERSFHCERGCRQFAETKCAAGRVGEEPR